MEVHDKRMPARVFAHPMEGKYTRQRRKEAEAVGRGEPPPRLRRQSACRKWVFGWHSEKLELVAEEEGHESDGFSFQRVLGGEDPGFTPEEIKDAVDTATTSTDLEDVHEASTLLREQTAEGGEEGCREVIRHHGIRAIIRLLQMADASVEEDAVMTLLNMLQHQRLRSLLADQGLMVPLVKALRESQLPSTKANIAAVLSLLTRSETQTWSLLTSGALETMMNMLRAAKGEAESSVQAKAEALAPLPPPPGQGKFRRSNSAKKVQGGILFSPSLSEAGDSSVHDACLALMHLARFNPVRRTLLKLGIVPLLVDVAKVAPMVDSEHSVAALFQQLARVEGGPEAVCIKDGGAGADALLALAEKGMDSTQEMALDALAAACQEPHCAQAVRSRGFVERLEALPGLDWASAETKAKVAFALSVIRR